VPVTAEELGDAFLLGEEADGALEEGAAGAGDVAHFGSRCQIEATAARSAAWLSLPPR
jgi:hypothetical protein